MTYFKKGSNAISHAAYKNHYEIVDYLVSKGVNANECDSVFLSFSCFIISREEMLFIWHAVKVQTKLFSTFFTIKSLKILMLRQMFFAILMCFTRRKRKMHFFLV